MKRLFFTILALFLAFESLSAQVPANIKFKSSKGLSSIKKDVEFVIDSVAYDPFNRRTNSAVVYNPSYVITVTQKGKTSTITADFFPKNFELKAVDDNLNNFWFARNLESLRALSGLKDLYKTRSEIELESNKYMNRLEENNLFFDDPYLESYLYSVISKIIPQKRADGFPYDLKIRIVNDPSLNASAFPNGIMLINTGLLANVHTEDELVAVLSHEIAHFVANHTLVNIYQMQQAKAKAQAAAALTATIGAVASAAATATSASSGYYYSNTSEMMGYVLLANAIANEYLERIGMQFSKEQEEEADKMAKEVLVYLGYDKNALATVFQRMADNYTTEGNWAAYYLGREHPSLKDRINYSGTPNKKEDKVFEKTVSFAVTQTAITKYNEGRFTQALKHVEQNIKNQVATDDDYLIKALCLMNLFSDNNHNQEAMSMVQKAKDINSGNSNIRRTEIIASLRVGDIDKAKQLLGDYIQLLAESLDKESDHDSAYYRFLSNERGWARNMYVKVKGL